MHLGLHPNTYSYFMLLDDFGLSVTHGRMQKQAGKEQRCVTLKPSKP